MKSNELIKLTSVDGSEDFECKPNSEFIAPKGKFRLWGDARITNEDNETVCHLRVLDFKEGAELPAILFPPKVKKQVRAVPNDKL
jgi:hypothetical protein